MELTTLSQPRVYPAIDNMATQDFRLREISKRQQRLEREREKEIKLCKRLKSIKNAVESVDLSLIAIGMGLGISGVGVLTTIVAAPIVIGLEIGALVCGVLGVTVKVGQKRIDKKLKKHCQIQILVESKLNTVAEYISRALLDGQISDQEFHMILNEYDKFIREKEKIRAKLNVIDDRGKLLIEQGKQDIIGEIQKISVNLGRSDLKPAG